MSISVIICKVYSKCICILSVFLTCNFKKYLFLQVCVSCIVSEFFVYISSIFIKRISEILQDVFLRYCQIHLFDFWVQFSVEEEVNWAQTFPLQSLESIKDLTSCPKQKVSKLVAKSTLQSSDDDLEQNVLLPPPDPDPDPDPRADADRFFRLPVCWSINNHDDY